MIGTSPPFDSPVRSLWHVDSANIDDATELCWGVISEEGKNWNNAAWCDEDLKLIGRSDLRGLHEARKCARNVRAKRLERRANRTKSYVHGKI